MRGQYQRTLRQRAQAIQRRKKQREYDAGYRRSTVALSPTSLDVVERIKGNFGLPSREATINAVFELINSDMFLWAEFMSPRHAPKPEPVGESDPGQ